MSTITIPLLAADGAKSTVTVAVPPVGATGQIIPANRITLWQPGVTYNGGIPSRTTIYKTLSPLGGTKDDTAQIQAALDSCPANQVVQLAAGTFRITGNGLQLMTSNITMRGVGPGTGASGGTVSEWNNGNPNGTSHLIGGGTGTFLLKTDRETNYVSPIMQINDPSSYSSFAGSTNLTTDTVLNDYSCKVASAANLSVGQLVLLDHITNNDPNVYWNTAHDGPGGGSRRWFIRQDRSICQVLKIASISGLTVTFETPIRYAFKTAYTAQLSRYSMVPLTSVGIEGICFMGGMGGDGMGNVEMNLCQKSWIKNCEAYWHIGTSIGMNGCYRCEIRDSYIHESAYPEPGGGGYLCGIVRGAADCLVENNIMWCGNKVMVCRASGGGNVIAYNYMDDAFGLSYPQLPEAGVNAGHYTTPHFELIEGNWSHSYTGDCYWGNSIYITAFRNWLTGLRGARKAPLPGGGGINLATYTNGGNPYADVENRYPLNIQIDNYNCNFVGNVLGFSGQTLLSHGGGYAAAETAWVFENLTALENNDQMHCPVTMYRIGSNQKGDGSWGWSATTYQTQLRDGNWDWMTASQTWLGIGGTKTNPLGTPKTIPNSLYLTSVPAFFGSNPWPWVDPVTGTTYVLPAKARFDALKPNG